MTLADLIARVEGLTGPDRELDAAIDVAVFGGETVWKTANYTMESYPASRRPSKHHVGGFVNDHVPLYTASIDAVVALIERELPGWMRSIMTGHGKTVAHVRDKSVICEDKIEGSGYSSLEACALLSAFLRALDAIAQRNGGKT